MSILLGTFYNNWLFCIAWLMYELIQMQRRDPQLNYSWGKTIFTGICKRLHTSIGGNQILLAVMNFELKCTKIGVTVPFFSILQITALQRKCKFLLFCAAWKIFGIYYYCTLNIFQKKLWQLSLQGQRRSFKK